MENIKTLVEEAAERGITPEALVDERNRAQAERNTMTNADNTYPASAYLAAPGALDDLNITAATTDAELESIRDHLLEENARDEDITLDPRDLLRELRWYRDNA